MENFLGVGQGMLLMDGIFYGGGGGKFQLP